MKFKHNAGNQAEDEMESAVGAIILIAAVAICAVIGLGGWVCSKLF